MPKKIPEFPAYCATKDGRIWSRKTRQFLEPYLHNGYFLVSLYKNSKSHHGRIHRLVLETFIGPCPEGMECCHANGIRTDNRLENLRWDTRSNNAKDSMKHGTSRCLRQNGEAGPGAKLREKDVRMIIYMYRTGLFLMREIADIYNIGRQNVGSIINKRSWKHIWEVD